MKPICLVFSLLINGCAASSELYLPNQHLNPLRTEVVGSWLYFIDGGALKRADLGSIHDVKSLVLPHHILGDVPVKELSDFASMQDGSFILLNRTGDVFRYFPETMTGKVERYAIGPSYSQRQYLAAVRSEGDAYYLLDIRLGLIWKHRQDRATILVKHDLLVNATEFAVVDQDVYVFTSQQNKRRLVKFAAPHYSRVREFKSPQSISQAPNIDPQWRASQDLSPPRPDDPRILDRLVGLSFPLDGAALPQDPFLLPGAPRVYRYGIHEGIDLSRWTKGKVTRSTPVLAVADGQIIRADWNYVEPNASELDTMRKRTQIERMTPLDILDRFRGRQIWLDLGNDVVVYYGHLSGIAEGISMGKTVSRGEVLGYVGNSGTPQAQWGDDINLHLHFELRIAGHYVGQYLRHGDVATWLDRVFCSNAHPRADGCAPSITMESK